MKKIVRDPEQAQKGITYKFPLEDSALVNLDSLLVRVGVRPEGEIPSSIPASYALDQNYSNPFNPSTTIKFDVSGTPGEKQPVVITVYDIRGRHIITLIDAVFEPGSHLAVWDGRYKNGESIPSGIYLYSLKIGDRTYTRKMMVLK